MVHDRSTGVFGRKRGASRASAPNFHHEVAVGRGRNHGGAGGSPTELSVREFGRGDRTFGPKVRHGPLLGPRPLYGPVLSTCELETPAQRQIWGVLEWNGFATSITLKALYVRVYAVRESVTQSALSVRTEAHLAANCRTARNVPSSHAALVLWSVHQ